MGVGFDTSTKSLEDVAKEGGERSGGVGKTHGDTARSTSAPACDAVAASRATRRLYTSDRLAYVTTGAARLGAEAAEAAIIRERRSSDSLALHRGSGEVGGVGG